MSYFAEMFSDGAWQPFVSGLGVTVLITACSLLLGTILGAVLCAMNRSRFKVLKSISRGYVIFIRGTPVLLLLMLFYYVILAPYRTDSIITAFIAFGLNSAAHVSEIMCSGLDGVDAVEIEAARSLGFSKTKTFFLVQLPQASRLAKPVYQNAVVNLLQWTSVVGYIAISDLTRVVNNMGTRTGNPFLALATGIILYLLLGLVTSGIFKLSDYLGQKKHNKYRVKR